MKIEMNGLPRDLKSKVYLIADKINKHLWLNKPPIVENFTDHKVKHSLSVIKNINTLVENSKHTCKLKTEEKYILCLCAFLHDIGLQCDFRKHKNVYMALKNDYNSDFMLDFDLTKDNTDYTISEQNAIRSHHHIISALWIKEIIRNTSESLHSALKEISHEYLNDIISICKYHSKISLDDTTESNNGFDLPKLQLIFRLADELDIGRQRIDEDDLAENFSMPKINRAHWYINYISKISITKLNDISLKIRLSEKDYDNHKVIARDIIDDFCKKNNPIIEKLRSSHNLMVSFNSKNSNVEKTLGIHDLQEDLIDCIYLDIYHHPYINMEHINPLKEDPEKKLKCYISYDPQSIKEEYIQEIEKMISTYSNKTMDVKYNTRNYANEINQANCIIILLNKAYIDKIDRNDALREEYETILNKYNSTKDGSETYCIYRGLCTEADENNDFEYIEKFKYNYKFSATIDYINELKLKKIKYGRDLFKMEFSELDRHSHSRIFEKMFYETLSIIRIQSKCYKNVFDKLSRNFFLNTKDEEFKLPKDCFVKTMAYKRIKNDISYIIIGRKGSGKSTVVNIMTEVDKSRYLGIAHIKAQDLSVKRFFSDYNNFKNNAEMKINSIQADIKDIFDLEDTFSLVWEYFIFLYSYYIVYREYEYGNLSQDKIEIINKMSILKRIPLINELNVNNESAILYRYAKNAILEFCEKIINKRLNKKNNQWALVEASIKNDFNINNLLVDKLGKKNLEMFNKLLCLCDKRILITMDKFDTYSEQLRFEKNNTADETAAFEAKWLRTFVEKTYAIITGAGEYSEYCRNLYKLLSFCITIPHDKYSEFIKWNRDAYKYNNKFIDLSWSGIELAILLRKRIEYLSPNLRIEWRRKGLKSPEEILSFCLKSEYPNVPDNITININGKVQQHIPLFQYVLRMSFWRPRDILEYYAAILSYASSYTDCKEKKNGTGEMIKRRIKEAAVKIIENEFFREYEGVFLNIQTVVNCFINKDQVMSWEDLNNIIRNQKFDMLDINSDDIYDKFQILYEIGFLGIKVTEEFKDKYTILHDHAFVFNEGRYILHGIRDKKFSKCEFIIHPIFTEKLRLIMNTKDLLCYYDWDYLHNIEHKDSL